MQCRILGGRSARHRASGATSPCGWRSTTSSTWPPRAGVVHRRHQPAADGELVQPGRGQVVAAGGGDDAVVGRARRVAQAAVAVDQAQRRRGAGRPGWRAPCRAAACSRSIDTTRARQQRQQRRLVAAAGADLEHAPEVARARAPSRLRTAAPACAPPPRAWRWSATGRSAGWCPRRPGWPARCRRSGGAPPARRPAAPARSATPSARRRAHHARAHGRRIEAQAAGRALTAARRVLRPRAAAGAAAAAARSRAAAWRRRPGGPAPAESAPAAPGGSSRSRRPAASRPAPAGRRVVGQVHLQRRDRDAALRHGVEVGALAAFARVAGRADPVDRLAARVGLARSPARWHGAGPAA